MVVRIVAALLCFVLASSASASVWESGAPPYHPVRFSITPAAFTTFSIAKPPPTSITFTPNHLYYMSNTGCSDANAGTSTSVPWCTPNHNLVCGDVILGNGGQYGGTLAANGSTPTSSAVLHFAVSPAYANPGMQVYDTTTGATLGTVLSQVSTTVTMTSASLSAVTSGDNISFGIGQNWGAVSTCPSTANGIDALGGVYFGILLCADASVGGCFVNDVGAKYNTLAAEFDIGQNNWMVQGWQISTNTSSTSQLPAFLADGRLGNASGGNVTHHICFVNDIATNTGMGYATADGGTNHGVVPGNGVDQWCVVGSIGQDSNSWTQCIGAFDDAGPANFDGSSGTHVFLSGNFAINNQQKYGCGIADGEMFFFDTWDAHGYTGQGVMQDNLGFKAERYGLDAFYQGSVTTATLANIRMVYNTIYDASNDANGPSGGTFVGGGILNNVAGGVSRNFPFPTVVRNNIVRQSTATSAQGTALYAYLADTQTAAQGANITVGGTGVENVMFGLETSCVQAFCNTPRFDVTGDDNPWNGLANFYEDPAFKNVTDAMTNHIGAPNCTGFATTVACMGWNYSSQTATSLSVIDDFTATSTHSPGNGYLPPQSGCLTSGERFNNFPAYLKGTVRLHAVSGWTNGTAIVMINDLLNKPCNL